MRFEIKMAQNKEKWKKKRKLWDLKLRWLKMKKHEKKEEKLWDLKLGRVKRIFVFRKTSFASKKTFFLYCYCLAGFLALRFKDDL